MGKYDASVAWLRDDVDADLDEITVTWADLNGMCGGLPESAQEHRTWWGNADRQWWVSAGWHVAPMGCALGVSVTFRRGPHERREPQPRRRAQSGATGGARPVVADGRSALGTLVAAAGYDSVLAAVAKHTWFVASATASQTGGAALFPIIRGIPRMSESVLSDGRRVQLDDNTAPKHAFCWATGTSRPGPDTQTNHIWSTPTDPDAYTALCLVVTPAFLAKTTDAGSHPEVQRALQFHAYKLHGHRPAGFMVPIEPESYAEITWPEANMLGVDDLRSAIKARAADAPRSSSALALERFGWPW